jgi:hypothetical protein
MTSDKPHESPNDTQEELTPEEEALLEKINGARKCTIIVDPEPESGDPKPDANEPNVYALTMAGVRGIVASYRFTQTTGAVEQLLTELLGIEVRADASGQIFYMLCGEDSTLAMKLAKATDGSAFNWPNQGGNAGPRDYAGESVVVNLHIRALALG